MQLQYGSHSLFPFSPQQFVSGHKSSISEQATLYSLVNSVVKTWLKSEAKGSDKGALSPLAELKCTFFDSVTLLHRGMKLPFFHQTCISSASLACLSGSVTILLTQCSSQSSHRAFLSVQHLKLLDKVPFKIYSFCFSLGFLQRSLNADVLWDDSWTKIVASPATKSILHSMALNKCFTPIVEASKRDPASLGVSYDKLNTSLPLWKNKTKTRDLIQHRGATVDLQWCHTSGIKTPTYKRVQINSNRQGKQHLIPWEFSKTWVGN